MAAHSPSGKPLPRNQSGFSYLLVLLLVVLMGIGLGAAGTLWSTESKRIKESDLLYIGEQYRKAISSYYTSSPDIAGETKHYPGKLEDLVLDTRQTNKLTRHLRKLYPDPVTGKNEWGLIRDPVSKEISGVYSQAPGQPLKQQGFNAQQQEFAEAVTYADWRFEAKKEDPPPAVTPTAPADPGTGTNTQ